MLHVLCHSNFIDTGMFLLGWLIAALTLCLLFFRKEKSSNNNMDERIGNLSHRSNTFRFILLALFCFSACLCGVYEASFFCFLRTKHIHTHGIISFRITWKLRKLTRPFFRNYVFDFAFWMFILHYTKHQEHTLLLLLLWWCTQQFLLDVEWKKSRTTSFGMKN